MSREQEQTIQDQAVRLDDLIGAVLDFETPPAPPQLTEVRAALEDFWTLIKGLRIRNKNPVRRACVEADRLASWIADYPRIHPWEDIREFCQEFREHHLRLARPRW